MRQTFSFSKPTLPLSLVIQILGFFLLWLSCLPIASQAYAAAPITPSGLNTQVNLSVTPPAGTVQYDITGGTRPGGGVNLFHSFGDFNVPTNNIANFLNTGSVDHAGNPLPASLPTSNILGVVTGVNPSIIFGAIQTNGTGGFGNANLFLMNPNGFLFGPNATVNVGGMVAFTTADYLRFTNGVLFKATPNAAVDPLLHAAPIAAFGFLGSNPAAIAVQGSTLEVQPGQSISLVGGNQGFTYTNPDTGSMVSVPVPNGVTVTGGHLLARGGQVNIASIASPGEIMLGTLAQVPNINDQSFGTLGAIQVSQQSVIDVSGNGGGTVLIRGGQFVLDNSIISANITGPGPFTNGAESIGDGIDIVISQGAVIQNGALIDTSVVGNATPGVTYGGVHIDADHIEESGVLDFAAGLFVTTTIQSNVDRGSTGGNAGNITLKANHNLDIRDIAFIQSLSQSATGDAGNITLTSTNGNISLTNNTIITSQTIDSPGTAGNISLSAPDGDILVADTIFSTYIQPPINADGMRVVRAGGSGEVQITANNLQMNGGDIGVINLSTLPPGEVTVTLSGNLTLRTGNLTLPNGSILFPSSSIHAESNGPASSAGLIITAHNILVTDGSSLTTSTVSSGAAGPLNISTVKLQLTNGGKISSESRLGVDPSTGLTGGPLPEGSGGTVTIQGTTGPAQSVLIDGARSGIFTNTVGTGAGGNINVLANTVTVQNGGTLSAETTSSGNAGSILVKSNSVSITSGALLTSSSRRQTSFFDGEVITPPTGNGGTVTLQGLASPAQSALIDGSGSGIFTDTQGTGAGGNILLNANSVTLQNDAHVTSSSTGHGNAGNIVINAGQDFTATNSTVTTEANQASGGIIKITTDPGGTVQLTNSTISASVLDGAGGGGSVNIDPQSVILLNSQILAQAVQGPGGNISITTNLLLPDTNSVISASSQFGVNGTVTIQSPNAPASGQIQPLGKSPLFATSLLNQRCAALAGGEFSSFTVAGRDSLPTEPGSWLASPLYAAGVDEGQGVKAEGGRPEGMTLGASPAGETPLLSLRQIAPAGFLTQTFAVDWSANCQS